MSETLSKYITRDCHDCARPVQGQVCTMSARDINTCLSGNSRPFWRPKPERSCDNCNQRISSPDLKCPLEPETQGECARDGFGAWEPIGKYLWGKKQGAEHLCETKWQVGAGDFIYLDHGYVQRAIEEMEKRAGLSQDGTDTTEQKPEPGTKFDKGKLRYDLLPGDVLEEITHIYTMGAEKYQDRNWEKGMSWGRVFGAAMRHSWAFWTGRTIDPESGRPHLAHAIVNLMFLLAYHGRGVGTDDRGRRDAVEGRR